MIRAIDLLPEELGDGAISTYLILDGEPALVDPGPSTTLPRLRAALAESGLGVGDLRHLMLTHVHVDHAGAAGHLVAENPRLAVHIGRDGAHHLANPAHLLANARRLFGEAAFERLWGEIRPVPLDALKPWEPSTSRRWPVARVRPLPTPGHIGHHMAFLHEGEGTVLVGDAMGVVLAAGAPTHPLAIPPAIDLAAWRTSLERLRAIGAERAGFTHFGLHEDVEARTWRQEEALARVEDAVRQALEQDRVEEEGLAFEERARDEMAEQLPRARVDRFFDVFRPLKDWRGVERYVRTHPHNQPPEGAR